MTITRVVIGLAVAVNGLGLAIISLYCLPIQSNEQFVLALGACYLTGMLSLVAGAKIAISEPCWKGGR